MRHLLRKKNTLAHKLCFNFEACSDEVMFLAALMAWSDASLYDGKDPARFCEHAVRYWSEAPKMQEGPITAPWCRLAKHVIETKTIHVILAVAWADRALASDVFKPAKFVDNAKHHWHERLKQEGRDRWEPLAFNICKTMMELSHVEVSTAVRASASQSC